MTRKGVLSSADKNVIKFLKLNMKSKKTPDKLRVLIKYIKPINTTIIIDI